MIDNGTKAGEGILAWGFPLDEKNRNLEVAVDDSENYNVSGTAQYKITKIGDGLYTNRTGRFFEKLATIIPPRKPRAKEK